MEPWKEKREAFKSALDNSAHVLSRFLSSFAISSIDKLFSCFARFSKSVICSLTWTVSSGSILTPNAVQIVPQKTSAIPITSQISREPIFLDDMIAANTITATITQHDGIPNGSFRKYLINFVNASDKTRFTVAKNLIAKIFSFKVLLRPSSQKSASTCLSEPSMPPNALTRASRRPSISKFEIKKPFSILGQVLRMLTKLSNMQVFLVKYT